MSVPGRVFLTGIGAVLPGALGREGLIKRLSSEETLLSPVMGEPTSHRAALEEFDPSPWIPRLARRRMNEIGIAGTVAACMALRDAGVDDLDPCTTGIVLGTGFGPTRSVDRFFEQMVLEGPAGANPSVFPVAMPNAIASQVAGHLRLGGPNVTVSEHEISGEIALTVGAAWIREGRVRRVLVGGADEISELIVSYLVSHGRLATTDHPIRPLDRSAQGPGLGEGAVFVLLDAEDQGRGAVEVGPWALSGRPSGDRADEASALTECISDCRMAGSAEPELVFCGANGDPRIDEVQARALAASWPGRGPLVTTVKSLFGESLSGGMTAVAAAAIALGGGPVPGILGLREPREVADRLDLVRCPCSGDGVETAYVVGSSSSGSVVSLSFSRGGSA